MDTVKVGAFLRELRKEKNMTQEQLAEVFGITNRTVSRWETGSNMPDIGLLLEIADYYQLEVLYQASFDNKEYLYILQLCMSLDYTLK